MKVCSCSAAICNFTAQLFFAVIINATERFKGFIITSTVPGTGYPARFVGKFDYRVWQYTTENLIRACENTMAHS